MQEEIWKDIPDYENRYQASNLGRIKSLPKIWISGIGLKRFHNGIILKQTLNSYGYPVVYLSKNGRKLKQVSRLVLLSFVLNKENKPTVNHINGIKTDNRIENLEWATFRENNIHAINVLKRPTRKSKKLTG